MLKDTPIVTYLNDYTPPNYLIDKVELNFELDESRTRVTSILSIRRNSSQASRDESLVLNGELLELVSVRLDGILLGEEAYEKNNEALTIRSVPESFNLEIVTIIHPAANRALEGLYVSGGMFCTQCEAEGFRHITYYLDRSDVMAKFSTRIVADKLKYPVLLSNGNLLKKGELENGRHWARWEDPFRKPSYLFALVAGNLECLQDTYTTREGNSIDLQFYVEPGNLGKCDHAMASLKKAMKWDEDVFGLAYDLSVYMVVAVGDFNMGAMENKGLNVFNTAYVLANPDSASDSDYENVEGVIGHEYFHNWTGNRVTCRDWFQLSLKEGLTVFRDQEFSADMGSRAVKRINDVRALRARQFPEDAGPMAHPVRPDSYVEINNFYTATVYEKGAEVVRMIHTLVGADGFRRGMDLYFERFDGLAVTTDDFVQAMEDANEIDLTQFRLWYRQAGTPVVTIDTEYIKSEQTYIVTLRQRTPPTAGQKSKKALHIPFRMGLLDANGNDMPLVLEDGSEISTDEAIHFRQESTTYKFTGIKQKPVPSFLRGFSAPVKLEMKLSNEDLAFLFANDADSFNRWEAGQQLVTHLILNMIDDLTEARQVVVDPLYINAIGKMLTDRSLDKALVAESLVLPAEGDLTERMTIADPEAIHQTRQLVMKTLAVELKQQLIACYSGNKTHGPYQFNARASGQRRLRNRVLRILATAETRDVIDMAVAQYENANNMTDRLAAVNALVNIDCAERQQILDAFHDFAGEDALIQDKWFSVQASSSLPDTLDTVRSLMEQPEFDINNPNKVRSVIGSFCHRNLVNFHAASGRGYQFLAEQVMRLDESNSQIAARLVGAFNRWKKYDANRQVLARNQLEKILSQPGLSKAVYEIVSRNLEK
ncbi:MAG: aminopeptidase N [Acidiferrobacterales bacterium]